MLQEEEGEGGYGSYKEAFRGGFLILHGFHIRKDRWRGFIVSLLMSWGNDDLGREGSPWMM